MLLRIDGVARSHGARMLFRDVTLEVRAGDRIGLIGPNGAGKTTLLKIAAGEEPPDAGSVTAVKGARVARLKQEIDPSRGTSLRAEVDTALAHLDLLERELRALEEQMAGAGRRGEEVPAALGERYDRCRTAFEAGGGFERDARVTRTLAGIGFAEEAMDRPLSSFSGGWLVRIELAKLLLSAPDVLLLDEPTNHLDLPSIAWFEETLAAHKGGVVVISHDRTFLRRHATRIAELADARCRVFDLGYDAFVAGEALRREQLEAERAQRERKEGETRRFIERFRYKASKARQVQSRIKALEKTAPLEDAPRAARAMRMRIPEPARAGEQVLRLEGIHKRYGERAVYTGVDFGVRRGERVALVGPNGAGKSTLLRIAAGVLAPDAGERTPGHNVTVAFYAQHQLDVLDPARSVLEELERVATLDDIPRLRGHLGAFLFSGDDVGKKVAVLSGGEKARLALAKLLLRPSNFLVLDEPTNHLDLAAVEVLEEALREYTGTLLLISHDRAFLDAIATRIVEVRGGGGLESFPGSYSDYARRQRGEAPAPAVAGAAPATDAAPVPSADEKSTRIAARERAKEETRRRERAARRAVALEEEIAELEERLELLTSQLASPDVYRDGELVRAIESDRSELREEIARLYGEWERAAQESEPSQ
ncbi:MAG TPA: ABC-F family ATP-binding cassette domain-containing protein [Myxococcota bacterium]|nr:ABC-F family ATP-binding cassette domain-containing protein [Myxococcota bacterium]